MARYTDQFGREFHTPADLTEAQAHQVAQQMARAALTPPQRALYESGQLDVCAIDDLGRKHWLLYAAPGRLLEKA